MLGAYFTVADEMLEFAFPAEGFPHERIWVTNKIKDSHETYNIYSAPYEEGLLFSWTRANNGNSYSFFYDNFDPPVSGWYELTFDAMKVGEFEEDVSLQVYAGKYYYADDRPQPQRLLDVISLGNRELKSHTIRVFLNPGENVSVHCYSKHTFRKKDGEQGAYIKQLKVRGPVLDQWPPASYQKVFGICAVDAPTVTAMRKRLGFTNQPSARSADAHRQQFPGGNGKGEDAGRFQPDVLAYAIQTDRRETASLRHPGESARCGD